MKITDVKITPSFGPETRHWCMLKIFTDEGIVGLGETFADVQVGRLKNLLVGRDPTQINQLHYDHLWQMKGQGAGIEIALWDIRGKQLGEPMHALLGGKLRDRVRMYCDCHSGAHWTREDYERRWTEVRQSGELDPVYEPEAYNAMAREVVGEGYTAIKFDLDVPNPWKLISVANQCSAFWTGNSRSRSWMVTPRKCQNRSSNSPVFASRRRANLSAPL